MLKKVCKLAGTLAMAAVLTVGFSAVSFADAPGEMTMGKKYSKGMNYPAYLYAKGQKWEKMYDMYKKPAKGYNFDVMPLASKYFTPEW